MHMHMHECAGTGVREKPVTQEGNISWVISEMCSPHHVLSTMLKRSYPTPYGPSKYSTAIFNGCVIQYTQHLGKKCRGFEFQFHY